MSDQATATKMNRPLSNTNIVSENPLISPAELKRQYPRSEKATQTIEAGRAEVEAILDGQDNRLLVVAGPCSVHNVDSAKEYAERLLELRGKVSSHINLIMRVYFEKPRTTVGWKGLINDPHLNDTFDIETGLGMARELLAWLAELGMPHRHRGFRPNKPTVFIRPIHLVSYRGSNHRITNTPRNVQWFINCGWF